MSFINWGEETPDHRALRAQLEQQALYEQAIRIKLQAQSQGGAAGSGGAQSTEGSSVSRWLLVIDANLEFWAFDPTTQDLSKLAINEFGPFPGGNVFCAVTEPDFSAVWVVYARDRRAAPTLYRVDTSEWQWQEIGPLSPIGQQIVTPIGLALDPDTSLLRMLTTRVALPNVVHGEYHVEKRSGDVTQLSVTSRPSNITDPSLQGLAASQVSLERVVFFQQTLSLDRITTDVELLDGAWGQGSFDGDATLILSARATGLSLADPVWNPGTGNHYWLSRETGMLDPGYSISVELNGEIIRVYSFDESPFSAPPLTIAYLPIDPSTLR